MAILGELEDVDPFIPGVVDADNSDANDTSLVDNPAPADQGGEDEISPVEEEQQVLETLSSMPPGWTLLWKRITLHCLHVTNFQTCTSMVSPEDWPYRDTFVRNQGGSVEVYRETGGIPRSA